MNYAVPVGGILDAGRYPGGVDELIGRVTADLTESGFSAQPELDIMRWKYTKLLGNIRNALQAACGLNAPATEFARAARAETLACYEAAGIAFVPEEEMQAYVHAQIKVVDVEGYPRSGGSSWQSLKRGLSTSEADYLNGEIVLLGRQHGVATPYNRVLQTRRKSYGGNLPGARQLQR